MFIRKNLVNSLGCLKYSPIEKKKIGGEKKMFRKGDFDFSNYALRRKVFKAEKMFGGFTEFTDQETPVILNLAVRPAINDVLRALPEELQANFPDNVKKSLEETGRELLSAEWVGLKDEVRTLSESELLPEDSRKQWQKIRKKQETQISVSSYLNIEDILVFKNIIGETILILDDNDCKDVRFHKSFGRYARITSLTIGTYISRGDNTELRWIITIYLPEMEIEDVSHGAAQGLWDASFRNLSAEELQLIFKIL